MKKLVVSLSFLLGVFLFFSGELTHASGLYVDVKEDVNSITMSWKNEGDFYKIYKEGKLLWEGNKTTFKDTNLIAGELYGYKIGVYKNDKLIDINSIKTSTRENIGVKESTQRTSVLANETNQSMEYLLNSNVGSDSVSLGWDALPDDDGIYEIYRNQKLIGKTRETQYVDKKLKPGTIYTYEIIAKTEVNDLQKQQINDQIKKQGLALSKKEKENLYLAENSLVRIVETIPAISEKSLKVTSVPEQMSSLASIIQYGFRWTTFIEAKSVADPFSLGNWLKGDNRTFGFNESSYRTRTDVIADFTGGMITDSRKVGRTERYETKDLTGSPIKTGTASNTGIKVTKDINTSTRKYWRINHDVGVPFAAIYPNITYYVETDIKRDGSFTVKGSHDRMPSHEFYVFIPNSDTIVPIFQFSDEGAGFLIPGTPQKTFNISM